MNNQGGRPRGPGGVVGVLHAIGGNDRGKQYLMVNPTTQIGRGADQDFVLADIAVSRRHVQILIEGNRYRLRDLGSGNGTLINGVRTATALLNDGDQVEIGNTLLRFDHPPSAAAGQAPQPQAGAQARTMIADAPPPQPAPSYAAPQPAYAPPQQNYQQQDQMPTPILTGGHQQAKAGGLLDSPVKKAAVFGTLGLVVLLGGGLVIKKAMSGGSKEQADKAYIDATRAFSAGDYDGAKRLFGTVLALDPTNKLVPKQLKQCDVEIHAKGAIKEAQSLANDKRYDEELKSLDTIDGTSASYDDAQKLKKSAIPLAVAAYLAEAKDALTSDPDTAKQRIQQALELDPDNSDAKDLADKLKGAGGTQVAANNAAPDHVRHPRNPRTASATPTPHPTKSNDDDSGGGGGAGPSDVLASPSAAGPYRGRDFNGAAQALRLQAKSMKGAAAQKTIALAAQVARLGDAYNKAEADKTRNAASAVTEYQQAMGIDASIGKSTHAAYFKAQAGKLAKDAARQYFTQQNFDKAFEMSKLAQRFGDDGGVGIQLKAKAMQIANQAQAKAKSDPNGAKTLWRQVLRMVPAGDPAYVKAQQGLSSSSSGNKDEDED